MGPAGRRLCRRRAYPYRAGAARDAAVYPVRQAEPSTRSAKLTSPPAQPGFAERIGSRAAGAKEDAQWRIRNGLIGSQLIGLAFQRYILRAEPVATAEPDQVAAWAWPTIDRYPHDRRYRVTEPGPAAAP